MFVAIHATSRARVTSIASKWNDRLDELRELASSGQLICPVCQQFLWLRIAHKRRRHFAHRHLADCPMANQSAELLETKAILFDWLETKYPGTVQMDMPGFPGWELQLDLLVEANPDRKFAYLIFDRQQRFRQECLGYQAASGVHTHFIHTGSTLVIQSSDLALTASQRDFISHSEYDECTRHAYGGHLHFLRTEDASLHIYRGLHCVHQPNMYAWTALRKGTLSSALISPKTGEIVFTQDAEARTVWKQKKKLEEERAREDERIRQEQRKLELDRKRKAAIDAWRLESSASAPPGHGGERDRSPLATAAMDQGAEYCTPVPEPEQPPAPPEPRINGPYRCEYCGIETMNWAVATPSAKTCVCYDCLKRHLQTQRDANGWKR